MLKKHDNFSYLWKFEPDKPNSFGEILFKKNLQWIYNVNNVLPPSNFAVFNRRLFWDQFSDGQLLWLRDMTSYEVGGQAIFDWKCMFIQLFLKKVKLVDEMIQSAYLCAILTCQAQKVTTYLFRDFN